MLCPPLTPQGQPMTHGQLSLLPTVHPHICWSELSWSDRLEVSDWSTVQKLCWRKLLCQRYQAGRESRKQEHELLKGESVVDSDENKNAQENGKDETAIDNNDGSVKESEEEIKEMQRKVVVISYSEA